MAQETQQETGAPKEQKSPMWVLFWMGWVIATGAGWSAGLIAALLLAALAEGSLDVDQAFSLEAGLSAGLGGFLACSLQRIVLWRRAGQARPWLSAGHWVLVHAAAWLLAGVVLAPAGAETLFGMPFGVDWAFLVAATGLVAATQWLLVREYASRGWLWIAAGAVGWSLGVAVSLRGSYLAAGPEDPAGFLLCLGGGPLAGIATGAAAALCLRRSPPHPSRGRRSAILVGALWLALVAAYLAAFQGERILGLPASWKLPACTGEPGCPPLVMPGANLAHIHLEGASLVDADLRDANLRHANLEGANLSGADLSGADLTGASLYDVNLRAAKLGGSVLRGADTWSANLSGADLRGADLTGADLLGASLIAADLREADLTRANLSRADLRGADLTGAILDGATLHGVVIHEGTKLDAKARLCWEISNQGGSGRALRGADLAGANLMSADLSGADLASANLAAALLLSANLHGADLSGADLSNANLRDADLSAANLAGAGLTGAELTRVDLTDAAVTAEQLEAAASLKGAMMPDGTKHK